MPSRKIRSSTRQWLVKTDTELRRGFVADVSETVTEMYNYHRAVVARWEHKPRFETRVTVAPDRIEGTIKPIGRNAQIWEYVDKGTKPHLIPKFANPAVTLKFQTAYSARTAPVARYNVGTGRATGPWRSAKQVWHPGTEAREFSRKATEDATPGFRRRIERRFRSVS